MWFKKCCVSFSKIEKKKELTLSKNSKKMALGKSRGPVQ